MVAQAAFDTLTAEAPVDPEKVQVALLAKSGAAVGSGAAAGAADTREMAVAVRLRIVES